MPGRFGTIYPFVESRDPSLRMGRLVANFEFLKALLESGLFDEYHFFSQDPGIRRLLVERLAAAGLDGCARIKHFLYFDLKNAVSKLEYQAFHLGGFGYFMPGLAYVRNNWARNPFPITGVIHSLNGFESPYHFQKLCRAPFGPQDCLVCTSAAGKKVVENFAKTTRRDFEISFNGRLEQLPLGIDRAHFAKGNREAARKQLGWSPNVVYLLSIGRFSPAVKADHGPLLACIRRIVKKGESPAFKLVLAGGSDLGLALVKKMVVEYGLESVVEVLADFDDRMKAALYDAADIYLSLSDNFQETFGLSVVEAMAHGLPCLVSDFDGYKELVRHEQDGFRIATTGPLALPLMEGITEIMRFSTTALLYSQTTVIDVPELEQKIRLLLSDRDLRHRLGESGREHARQYDWSTVIRHYGDLWADLEQTSKTILGERKYRNNPFEIEFTSIFSHYFTNTLSGDTRFRIGRDGESVLLGQIALPGKYGDMEPLLIDELLILILQRVREAGTRTYDALLTELNALGVNADPSLFSIHLLWLAKYGLLEITKIP